MAKRTQLYVNGPAAIHVGTGAAAAMEFLGYSEAGMRMTFDFEFEEVMSDLSGTRIPFDIQKMGYQSFMTGDLTNYNEPVLRRLLSGGGTLGSIASGDIGALVNLEDNGGVRTHIEAPYGTKTAFSVADSEMETAYNFIRAILISPTDIDLSTKVKKVRFVFRAVPVWTINAGIASAVLYNNDATGINAKY